MLELSEPINVWCFFKGTTVQPYIFFWKKRKIKIDTINLVHTSKDGASLLYFFSVSAGNNFYRLKFDLFKLKWSLEALEEGE